MKLKHFLAAALLVCGATSVMAQETKADDGKDYKPFPYMFVGVQGGGQMTFGDYKPFKTITPTASISFGAFFTPVIGARLHVNGAWNKGMFWGSKETSLDAEGNASPRDLSYKYKYITTDLDLMLNLITLFGKKDYYPVNLYLIGGIGLNAAWGNGDAVEYASTYPSTLPKAWSGTKLSHNGRIGMQLDWNVAKHWSVNLEIDGNSLNDRYNSKSNNADDWSLTAQIGVAYKFGYKKKPAAPAPVVAPVVEDYVEANKEEATTAAVAVAPTAVVAATTTKNIFFSIREVTPNQKETAKVAEIAQFLNDHPNAKVTVTGYADAGTGTHEVNAKYASQRADSVCKLLTEKFGISADRITKQSKGDTEQPFSVNDENRVVIAVAE